MQKHLVDIHCHILPGIDDGSESLKISLEMALQAVKEGVSTIIATPHYIVGENEHDLATLKERVQSLQTEIDRAGLALKILTGSEVYICPELIYRIKENKLITLNETPYLLCEFPTFDVPEHLLDIVRELTLYGYKPVIAHPERNEVFLRQPEMVENLIRMGCYLQVNGSSIVGRNGSRSQKFIIDLLKKGLIHFISSDAHSSNRRTIRLVEPLRVVDSLARAEVSNSLVNNSWNVVNGNKIENINREALQRPKGVLGRLREVFSK